MNLINQGNPELISASFIQFTYTDWGQMYNEYLIALKKIRKYKKYLRNENKIKRKTRELNLREKQHRTIIYDTENGILETLQSIELYLSNDKRKYINKHKDNKIIIDGQIEHRYIPLNNQNLHEIISNKQYRNELYNLLEKELSPQQFKVISLYYGAGMIQDDIAKELGISQSNVSIYLEDAYNKIMTSNNIKIFLQMI